MKTKHKRAVARTIALVAALAFTFALPAFAGYINGSMASLGSFSCSTSTSSASTSVSPAGQFIYASASISTKYVFRNPIKPSEKLDSSDYGSHPTTKGSTASCSTSASVAKSRNSLILSSWSSIEAESTHGGHVNDEYGNYQSLSANTNHL